MGKGKEIFQMIIVLDTSCISAFILAGKLALALEILKDYDVVLTEQVAEELRLSEKNELKGFKHSSIKIMPSSIDVVIRHKIQPGEASIIALVKEHGAIAVLDDRIARQAAEKEKINFIGTASIVKKGIQKAILTKNDAEKLIGELMKKGKLFLSPEIIKWILE